MMVYCNNGCEGVYAANIDKFCSKCGAELPAAPLPYGGKPASRAVFRVTFEPVEAEFNNSESAWYAAYRAVWNEDQELQAFKVEKLRSAVPQDEYPYICSCGEYVSATVNCRCRECGEVDWVTRTK